MLRDHTHAVKHATVDDSVVEAMPLFDKLLLELVDTRHC